MELLADLIKVAKIDSSIRTHICVRCLESKLSFEVKAHKNGTARCWKCLRQIKSLRRQRANKRNTKYRKSDVSYRLAANLRSRLSMLIRNGKAGSAVTDLGCSVAFLRQHLESQFQPGMSWNNYGRRGWHIDHMIPLCKFDLTNREQFLQAVHYTNLQPLWAVDNWKKNKWTA